MSGTLILMVGLPCSGKTTAVLGVGFKIYYCDVPRTELLKRLDHRNESEAATTFLILHKMLEEFIGMFGASEPYEKDVYLVVQ